MNKCKKNESVDRRMRNDCNSIVTSCHNSFGTQSLMIRDVFLLRKYNFIFDNFNNYKKRIEKLFFCV